MPDPKQSLVRALAAGAIAGMVMSVAMMMTAVAMGTSVWTMPDLIAAMWFGPAAANGALGGHTLVGFLTHEMTSALMGVVALPFLRGLRGRQAVLVAMAYALASYPLVFAFVLSWANPTMYAAVDMVQMTWSHLLFGLVLGLMYPRWIERPADANQRRSQ